ncbi:UDP-N-acetylglucosamine 2-epimerase (non-hydrolyzing) [Pseudomonas sichuanensis]|nr:UDP-N-acetylglucosamine 2-epimerase (non-hydrolyzing) [Pseudomonas sichuanensis]MDH1585569.1 UDP-N-acetylglucosamine 2-epimerase (non-hydrolyzing) [Pseudomonas sichuanensis]MDH1594948.1 UDP-N-acetylglucosamine 2-epimerase (non-hydrolyzing) [Pseudomonas sichuanensis]MDH1600262.1 UDP-N-acetylglucosamine 2-epimerase (non-hydrolyzing) [Pseudomonas sichuanensis]
MMKVLTLFGTRPEAIKMAPLVKVLARTEGIESIVCSTGQHRQMLDQVLQLFAVPVDHDLDVMVPGQTLNGLFARLMTRIDALLDELKPDCVLVHGDTTTAAACSMAAFHRGIAIGHVEAGLRTGDLAQPFPEEMNRRVVDVMARWLFAPTVTSRNNLLQENLQGQIHITGNTVIDALDLILQKLDREPEIGEGFASRYPWLDASRRLILVTGHRRENFGEGFRQICQALGELAKRDDVQIVYPVHLNPQVRDVVMSVLGDNPNVQLIDPLDYLEFVWFMQRAHLVLTDSGGVQEEAPHLGKPVLVMRNTTERPEAVAAGTVKLVGTDSARIVQAGQGMLDDHALYAQVARSVNPYGDGNASERIVNALLGRPFTPFQVR